ncbi:MAG: hypothetical protein P1U68_12900 [Verrucomicrobiales bacterium]|nr:hypothetical protein [Verrucomicrobiales bacterium]
MAIRLGEFVRSGTIDCSVKGVITGEIFVEGMQKPMELELKGTPHPDIAGCVLTFSNPEIDVLDGEIADYLELRQTGFAGDMSAAQKRKVLSMPLEDFSTATEEEREAATVWKNTLYLEWFSHYNGRIVIEAVDYQWDIDLPRWTLGEEDIVEQAELAKAAMDMHLNFAIEIFQETNEEIRAAEDEIDPKAKDEFTWEKRLQESDKRADAFHALMEEARTPEEMEALAERAYADLSEDQEPDFGLAEEEVEIQAYEADESTRQLCEAIQNHGKQLIEEYYEALIGMPAHGEFLTLMVKSQTAAEMVASDGSCFERGFLIAHVKREIARSQRVNKTLEFFKAEVDPSISTDVWKLRDLLVDLAGQLRK